MKKIIFLFTIFLFTLNSYELKYAIPNNVGDLNPHRYSGEMFAQDMVFEGLVDFSEDSKIIPALATSWDISKDGLVYTFYLRKGVKFSNGEDFNANVVKANFDALLKDKNTHSWSAFMNALKEVKIVNDYTVKIYLSHSYEPTLRELSLVRPYRFQSLSSLQNNTNAIGTGKWVFVDTKLGEFDRFVRNENYWGKKPFLDEILCKVIPDANTRVIALKTGEVDYVYGNPSYLNSTVSLDSFEDFKYDKNFKIIVTKPINTTLIALNSSSGFTKDKNVRIALNMAIDKDAISKYVYYKTQPKADFFYPDDVPNAKINKKPYDFNIKQAQKLLSDSGYKLNKNKIFEKDGKILELNLFYIGSDAEQKAIAEVIQAQLKKTGIKLTLHADEMSTFYKRQKTAEFDMIFHSTWGAPYEPEIFMASFKVPAHADFVAQSGIKEKALIDSNIDKISSSTNSKEKAKLVKEVLEILHDEAIYIPIVFNTNKGIISSKFDDVKGSIIGYRVPFENIKVKK
ncbi:nickel ABC transporter, nickel/metallophore periplasmic binding protein [Campylobacter canadensis]|uniref:nickel ABC transporter substrate-binding protein n=1 Tax=Campylobacter canadensis TaxID=449520 RepID=UPI001CCDDF6D|nr:nickel ABC transporter substrate-binding protein [Campylobacter canadensis]MBZ7996510.1 nickel ABC transporter, nickel/metallophore periplasmic binding protein [Campylobacter canadensis]